MTLQQNFPTSFWVTVGTINRENGSHPSSMSTGYVDTPEASSNSKVIENIEEAQSALLQQIDYFTQLGYKITDFSIVEMCSNCNGRGTVVKVTGKRVIRRKDVKCPACRGKHSEHYHVNV